MPALRLARPASLLDWTGLAEAWGNGLRRVALSRKGRNTSRLPSPPALAGLQPRPTTGGVEEYM